MTLEKLLNGLELPVKICRDSQLTKWNEIHYFYNGIGYGHNHEGQAIAIHLGHDSWRLYEEPKPRLLAWINLNSRDFSYPVFLPKGTDPNNISVNGKYTRLPHLDTPEEKE